MATPAPPEVAVKPPEPPAQGCEAIRAEARKYSGWDADVITAIATSESRYHKCLPTEHNLTMSENHRVCVGSYGALQVGCLHYREGEDVNDLATNVKVAHRVWLSQGYTAWTEYKNGRYARFL